MTESGEGIRQQEGRAMWHDILSSLNVRDIVNGVANILVALALGYIKLRMDSERRRRREHERRVAATIRSTRKPDTHHDAGHGTEGKTHHAVHSEHDPDPRHPGGGGHLPDRKR